MLDQLWDGRRAHARTRKFFVLRPESARRSNPQLRGYQTHPCARHPEQRPAPPSAPVQAPRGAVAASRLILLDTECALRIARELRKWGVHYNQGIHALNTVALRIRHGDRDSTDMLEAVERAAALLEETEAAVRGMRSDMAALTGRPALFL